MKDKKEMLCNQQVPEKWKKKRMWNESILGKNKSKEDYEGKEKEEGKKRKKKVIN